MVIGPSQSHLTVNGKNTQKPATIKFLCSYGGKILPRYPDRKLRYLGGETRVLAVDRSISFAELQLKLRELCGASMLMRCQLPTEDLDSLVSITSDEDLTNLIEEYDRTCYSSQLPLPLPLPPLKIRALLSLPKLKQQDVSPSLASTSSNNSSSMAPRFLMPLVGPARCLHQQIPKTWISRKTPGQWKVPFPYYPNSGSYYSGGHHSNNIHLIHSGGHLQ